ncbi:hypothetical protein BDR22DRAFT_819869 [Usnea florida]
MLCQIVILGHVLVYAPYPLDIAANLLPKLDAVPWAYVIDGSGVDVINFGGRHLGDGKRSPCCGGVVEEEGFIFVVLSDRPTGTIAAGRTLLGSPHKRMCSSVPVLLLMTRTRLLITSKLFSVVIVAMIVARQPPQAGRGRATLYRVSICGVLAQHGLTYPCVQNQALAARFASRSKLAYAALQLKLGEHSSRSRTMEQAQHKLSVRLIDIVFDCVHLP